MSINSEEPWWKGGVIYQIYPRSFCDTNGDGVGDLPGIIDKLDYIRHLNVDAIWISPFFKSPMKDFGYDISDYRAVDEMFGSMEDFDALISQAHARGLKVIIDLVLSHTSDQHPWFLQSRESTTNEKSEWYVWSDPSPDGTPPNNWLSFFGGSAWEWVPRRSQYYLHNFLSCQPDLNFHNPDVVDAVLDVARFWLMHGVDGIRLDAITFCYHDEMLRDNPAKPPAKRRSRGFSPDNPYAYQEHVFDSARPENLSFLTRVRKLLDEFPGCVALGEVTSEESLATVIEYTEGNDRLHMAYSFELLTEQFSAEYIRDRVGYFANIVHSGYPCWSFSNHDVERVVSRWGGERAGPDMAALLLALLGAFNGAVCIYQGEELGLPEAALVHDDIQDPFGLNFWPEFKGRDGCRTPMPWSDAELHCGFSEGEPWLPIPAAHWPLSVERQECQSQSALSRFRRYYAWRQRQPALRWGNIEFLELPDPVLVFFREYQQQRLMCCFNLSDSPVEQALPSLPAGSVLGGHGMRAGVIMAGEKLSLPAWGCLFYMCRSE
jgi:alpha-glucosidase